MCVTLSMILLALEKKKEEKEEEEDPQSDDTAKLEDEKDEVMSDATAKIEEEQEPTKDEAQESGEISAKSSSSPSHSSFLKQPRSANDSIATWSNMRSISKHHGSEFR